MSLFDILMGGGGESVGDPLESYFGKKGPDNAMRVNRPFFFDQGLVDQRYAPIMEEGRKKQTQGSSLPEAVAEAVKEQYRAPGGMKNLPEPEYEEEPKKEFKGSRSPFGQASPPEPEYADQPTKEEVAALEGAGQSEPGAGADLNPGFMEILKNFGSNDGGPGDMLGSIPGMGGFTDIINDQHEGFLKGFERAYNVDMLGLGINFPKLELVKDFRDGMKRKAYKESLGKDGKLDEASLVKNLTRRGFGEEAYKLQSLRGKTDPKDLAQFKADLKTQAEEKKKLDNQKAEEDFLAKYGDQNTKVVVKAGNKTYTIDPNAVKSQRLKEAKEAYNQQKNEFVEGIPRLGGGGGGGFQAPGQAAPQIGNAPGRIQPGPGGAMDRGGRFPSTIGQEPGTVIANPREWNFSQRFTPELDPMTRPRTHTQAIKKEMEIKKELKDEFGKTPIRDETANRDKLNRIQRSVGKVEGDNLLPNVDTGQYKGLVGEYGRSQEYEELRAQFRRLSFESIPKGMSRLFDSEAERKMYEEAQPAMTNEPKTNWNIIQHMRSDLDRAMEYRRFKTAYGLKNQTTEGADEAWTEYTSNNPAVVNNVKGIAVENGLALSPKDYFFQDKGGAKPLPIDWNAVNKKYKNVNMPIVNVPDSTISNLKDDETYMFPGGARTGSQLKAMKKRVNEKGGGK